MPDALQGTDGRRHQVSGGPAHQPTAVQPVCRLQAGCPSRGPDREGTTREQVGIVHQEVGRHGTAAHEGDEKTAGRASRKCKKMRTESVSVLYQSVERQAPPCGFQRRRAGTAAELEERACRRVADVQCHDCGVCRTFGCGTV